MALSKDLLDILACPKCKGELSVVGKEQGLLCAKCAVVYRIEEEIPVMLIDEAIPAAEFMEKIHE